MDLNDLSYCGQCGYELTGLADEGQCPECGNRFNKRSGSGLRGDPNPSRRSHAFLRYLRTITIACIALCIMFCTGLTYLLKPTEKVIYSGAIMTLVALLGVVTSFVYDRNPD